MSPFLNYRPAWRSKYHCSGIKHCEYLHPDLKGSTHTTVDETLYHKLDKVKGYMPKNPKDPKQKALT